MSSLLSSHFASSDGGGRSTSTSASDNVTSSSLVAAISSTRSNDANMVLAANESTSYDHGGGDNSSSSVAGFENSEIQSVAKKIEERYQMREMGEQAFQQAEQENQEWQAMLQAVRHEHQATRITYLEEVQQTQGLELEYHRLQQEQRRHQHVTDSLTAEQVRHEQELRHLEETWAKEQQTMAAAVAKREWYLQFIRGAIQQKENLQLQRKRKIDCLKERTDRMVEKCLEVKRATAQMKNEITLIEKEDATQKSKAQQVSERVRAQLAERSTLRDSLREAQNACRQAMDQVIVREPYLTEE